MCTPSSALHALCFCSVKVRLQASSKCTYSGMADCFRKIYRCGTAYAPYTALFLDLGLSAGCKLHSTHQLNAIMR
jgi:hypothetical protein